MTLLLELCHELGGRDDGDAPLAIGGLGRPAWRFRLAADLLMDSVLGAGMSRA